MVRKVTLKLHLLHTIPTRNSDDGCFVSFIRTTNKSILYTTVRATPRVVQLTTLVTTPPVTYGG